MWCGTGFSGINRPLDHFKFLFFILILLQTCLGEDNMYDSHGCSGQMLQLSALDPRNGVIVASGTHLCTWNIYNEYKSVRVSENPHNEAKVLLVDVDNDDQFLYCDTDNNGNCAVYNLNDLSLISNVTGEISEAYLGSQASVFAMFGVARFTTGEQKNVLYVGQEKTPEAMEPSAFSSRYFVEENNHFQIQNVQEEYINTYEYYGESYEIPTNLKRSVKINAAVARDYKVRFIYGFSYKHFIFYVTIQQNDTSLNSAKLTTYLFRVCQSDENYNSIAEIELTCKNNTGSAPTHRLAQTAYFQSNGDDSQLFVVFASNSNGGSIADESLGSVVCQYSMTDVQMKFSEAFSECYDGDGNLLPWFHDTHSKSCNQKEREKRDFIDEQMLDYCHDPYGENHGVGYGYTLGRSAIATVEGEFISAIVTQLQKETQILIIGTMHGRIHKISINQDGQSKVYATHDIDTEQSQRAIAKSLLLSENEESIYVMMNNRVYTVPIATCGTYKECYTCVTVKDPLDCGWCDGRCTENKECSNNALWARDFCPPIITKFEPITGPVEGGTRVTVDGLHLGNWTSVPMMSLSFDNVICDILPAYLTDKIVFCEVNSAPKEMTSSLHVSVGTSNDKNISFSSSQLQQFSFKAVNVSRIYPFKGPRSGGTTVTIAGSNLNVGTSVRVLVAGNRCEINMHDVDKIECITRAFRNVHKRAIKEGPVHVYIDSFHFESTTNFAIFEDPSVTDISPRRSINSGGTSITVSGSNLNSISRPLIEIDGVQEKCKSDIEGNMMTCVSPSLETDIENPSISVKRNLTFVLDGVTELNSFPRTHPHLSEFQYYIDPNISQFATEGQTIRLSSGDEYLEIKGTNLDLGASPSDYNVTIGRVTCKVTNLYKDKLYCKLINSKHSTQKGIPKDVKVTVGNIPTVHVGYLYYELYVDTTSASAEQKASASTIIFAFIGIIAVISALIIFIVYFVRKKQRSKGRHEVQTTEMSVRYTAGQTQRQQQINNNYTRANGENVNAPLIGACSYGLSPEHLKLLEANNMMIGRDNLLMLEEVGKGNFGCVNRGLLKQEGQKEELLVAIKTMKGYTGICTEKDIDDFIEEALRMTDFNHKNVLRVIGISLDEHNNMPLVILPYMEHGDLLTYLRDERNNPTNKMLLEFGLDIANGMDYLVNLKFVHRDLAARNCMLNKDLHVLVADFGLSRDIYESQYYSSGDKQAKLPIKWMAPESLDKNVYNSRSDVWSYGVTLWELMTRGALPYPGVENWDITKYIYSGRRMDQPEFCPDFVYAIMLRCWDKDPLQRPTFAEVAKTLQMYISEAETSENASHGELYTIVPNSQGYAEKDFEADTMPQKPIRYQNDNFADYLNPVNSQQAAANGNDNYLTPSEHYALQAPSMSSQYLTSPRNSANNEKDRLLSSTSNNEPVEHQEF